MSKRISSAFAVTEGKVHLALPENCPYKRCEQYTLKFWVGSAFYTTFVDDIHSKTNDDIPSATDDIPPTTDGIPSATDDIPPMADCGGRGSITFFSFGNIMNTE